MDILPLHDTVLELLDNHIFVGIPVDDLELRHCHLVQNEFHRTCNIVFVEFSVALQESLDDNLLDLIADPVNIDGKLQVLRDIRFCACDKCIDIMDNLTDFCILDVVELCPVFIFPEPVLFGTVMYTLFPSNAHLS